MTVIVDSNCGMTQANCECAKGFNPIPAEEWWLYLLEEEETA